MSELEALREVYRKDILRFTRQEFGVSLESYQKSALLAFADPKRRTRKIVMKASAGVGKSATIAWAMWWFMLVKDFAKGVAISVTGDNLRDGVWRECASWLEKSELLNHLFAMNQKKIFSKEYPSTWAITARTYDKKADREKSGEVLSGLHGENLCYFLDECGSIVPEIGKSVNQGFSDSEAKFIRSLMAGNPLDKDSVLYKESVDKKNHVITINSDPESPDRSKRIDIEWARENIKKFGRKDPWVMTYILGIFPDVSVSSLLDESDVLAAMEREGIPDVRDRELFLGVDVARYGPDSNVWVPRQGIRVFDFEIVRNANTSELHRKTIDIMDKVGQATVCIDATGGYGAGLLDSLEQSGYLPHGINFGERADEEERFFNKRSEMYYKMAQYIKRGAYLPHSVELKDELCAVMYSYTEKGQLKIEPKEMMRKRLKKSPDIADALALTFSVPETLNMEREEEETKVEVVDPYDVDSQRKGWIGWS